MRNTRLLTSVKIVPAVDPYDGAAGAMTAVEVDGRGGFDRVLFVLYTGDATATGTAAWKVQAAATSGGSLSDVTSAAFTSLDDTGGNQIYVCDMPISAAKPFMKITGATATAAIANASIAILYRGDSLPIDTSYATQAVIV